MQDLCHRGNCPNAHGFAEIRGAMNDTSPICWKWLENSCKAPHCRYQHAFRRRNDRSSRDSTRNSLDMRHRTPRSSVDLGGRPVRSSMDQRRSSTDFKRGAQAASRRSMGDSALPVSGRASLDSRGPRPQKSFEMGAERVSSAASRAAVWGKGGSSAGGALGAESRPAVVPQLADIGESAWTKGPTRKSNGRSSLSFDRQTLLSGSSNAANGVAR